MQKESNSSKKRQRLILVCDNCHKRKIKCDRKFPCSSCQSRQIGALCRYSNLEEELSKQGKTTEDIKNDEHELHVELINLRNKVKTLEKKLPQNYYSITPEKSDDQDTSADSVPHYNVIDLITFNSREIMIGFNPIKSLDDNTNMLMEQQKRISKTIGHAYEGSIEGSPLLFASIIRREVGFQIFINNKQLSASNFVPPHNSLGMGRPIDSLNKICDAEEEARRYFGEAFIPRFYTYSEFDTSNLKRAVTLFLEESGVVFYLEKPLRNSPMYTRIISLLPPKSIILKYLRFYFTKINPFFPIFDVNMFLTNIDRIILEDSNMGLRVNIEQKVDIVQISNLLLMLKICHSYLIYYRESCSKNEEGPVDQDSLALLEYPIYFQLIQLAKDCLKEFDLHSTKKLSVLQAFILARIYKFISFEDNSNLKESDSSISSMIQVAISLGLNRDPENYPEDIFTADQKELRCNIWAVLIMLETLDAATYGKCITDDSISDVGPKGGINYMVLDLYELLKPLRLHLNALVKEVQTVPGPYSLKIITYHLSELEKLVELNFGSVTSYIITNNEFIENDYRLLKLLCLLHLKLFLIKFYSLLYIVYQSKDESDLLFYYFKKLNIAFMIDLSPLFNYLPGTTSNPLVRILISPVTIRYCSLNIIHGYLTVLHIKYSSDYSNISEQKKSLLYALCSKIIKAQKYSLGYFAPLAKKYYLAWKSCTTLLFGLFKFRTNDSFKEIKFIKGSFHKFTEAQVSDITQNLDIFLSRIGINKPSTYISARDVWCNFIPYDYLKTPQENLVLQRIHIWQYDSLWLAYLALDNDGVIPDTYKNDSNPNPISDIYPYNTALTNNIDVDQQLDFLFTEQFFDAFN